MSNTQAVTLGSKRACQFGKSPISNPCTEVIFGPMSNTQAVTKRQGVRGHDLGSRLLLRVTHRPGSSVEVDKWKETLARAIEAR